MPKNAKYFQFLKLESSHWALVFAVGNCFFELFFESAKVCLNFWVVRDNWSKNGTEGTIWIFVDIVDKSRHYEISDAQLVSSNIFSAQLLQLFFHELKAWHVVLLDAFLSCSHFLLISASTKERIKYFEHVTPLVNDDIAVISGLPISWIVETMSFTTHSECGG